jgi:hypothetical protein
MNINELENPNMDWMLTRLDEDSGEDADSELELEEELDLDQDRLITEVETENVLLRMVRGDN